MKPFCILNDITFENDYDVINFINSSDFELLVKESLSKPLIKGRDTPLGYINTILFKFCHTQNDGAYSVCCALCEEKCNSRRTNKEYKYKWEIISYTAHRSGTSKGADPSKEQLMICSYYKLLILLINEKLKSIGIEACDDCIYSSY